MYRRPHTALAILTAAFIAAAGAGPASAAKPAAAASPSPAPSASATPAPEPLDRAIPRLETHLKTDPNDKAAMTELATDYMQINRPDRALPLTQKLLASGTKTAQVLYIDGVANAQVGHQREALTDLEAAANLEPTNPGVLGYLTNLYLSENRPQDAERVAKRAVTFNKGDKASLETYGAVLAAEKKFDEARQQFEAAAKLDPKDPSPVIREAETYLQQNAVALAAQLYDRAVTIDPTNVQGLVGKARVEAAQHNVKDAIATYDQIFKLQTDPNDKVAVLDQEAGIYAAEHMDAQADATLRKAIADYPNVYTAHTAYGNYLAGKNDLSGAEREWKTGAGPNNDQADAIARLGQLYAQQNKYPQAVDEFRRLSQVSPNDPRSHLLLAAALSANKQFDKARDEYKSSYNLQHTPDALLGLGQADLRTRQYQECSQVYEALDKGAPGLSKQDPQVLFGLGQCYQHLNRNDKAKGAYQRLLSYLKPGSQGANEVKALIDQIDRQKKPAPHTTSKSAAGKG